jgi:hypothetical protein
MGYELGVLREAGNRHRLQDKETFARLTTILTKNNFINYLRDQDFGGVYRSSIHSTMDELYYFSLDPRNRFIDKQLDKIAHALETCIPLFGARLALASTQPNPNNLDISCIAQAYHDVPPYDHFTLQEYETLRAELNQKVDEIWRMYSNLIDISKRKL